MFEFVGQKKRTKRTHKSTTCPCGRNISNGSEYAVIAYKNRKSKKIHTIKLCSLCMGDTDWFGNTLDCDDIQKYLDEFYEEMKERRSEWENNQHY